MSKWRTPIDYPFIVMGPRSRLVKVKAIKFSNALSRALSLYPNKFLKTQFAKRMDLVSANEEAKKKSLKSAHKQFVVLLPDGDFEVENQFSLDDKADVYATWHKGKKIDGPAAKKVGAPTDEDPVAKAPKRAEPPTKKELKQAVKSTPELKKAQDELSKALKENSQSNKTNMKTKEQKSTKKVAAPKKLAKAEKETRPVKGKKPASIKKIEGAKIVAISIKDMRAGLKKGFKYYDPQGVSQNEKYLASRANQDYVREGMQELKPAK